MPKKYSYPFPEDWLEEIVNSIQQQKSQGLKPILSHLLQSLLNSIMLKKENSSLNLIQKIPQMASTIETFTSPSAILTLKSLV